jgi:hypothetical protein
LLIFIAGIFFATAEAQNASHRTVWDGVYTAAQAERGKRSYDANCASCHGSLSGGNRVELLHGKEFMERWREDNLSSLLLFLEASMPPLNTRPKDYAPLNTPTYLEIVTYILQGNGFPAGSDDLQADVLKDIQIEEKDGPKPLATSTLVQVVGCMTRSEQLDGVVWMLTRATEPMRTRDADRSNADELKTAGVKSLGNLSFKLQNLGYLGSAFDPNTHNGQKMYAKGTLIKQTSGQRLNITFLQVIDSMCVK